MSKNLLVSWTVENICLYSFQIQSKKELHYLLPLYSGFCFENFPVFTKGQNWWRNKIKFKLFVLSQSCNLKFSVHSSWLKKVVLSDTVLGSYFLCFFQAIVVMSCDSGQIFPPIQCNENGPCPTWTSFCGRAPICRGPVISWICSLQGRTGKDFDYIGNV